MTGTPPEPDRTAAAGAPLRDRLIAMRRQAEADLESAVGGIAAVTAARADANSDDEHDPEGATIGFERAQVEALLAAAGRRLEEVDRALARLADGTYGVCAVCGAPVVGARLEARPTTDRCIRHA